MRPHVRTSVLIFAVLIVSGIAAAAHTPSRKHLKRSFCLQQCAAEIQAKCVPHHGFHRCRGTLIRACQHFQPVCGTTTTTTAAFSTTTTTAPPIAGTVKGALAPTLGRFNYNGALGLPGALAACQATFGNTTHVCTLADLQNAQAAGGLVGLKDTTNAPVTSFWAIDSSQPPLQQCNDDAPSTGSGLNWEYGTAHTMSRGDKVPLDNATGMLGALQPSQQCALLGTPATVACCQ
jgi:hypothetical protein